jgi:kumamolisin
MTNSHVHSYLRKPRASDPVSYNPPQVGKAYHYPSNNGQGMKIGLVELGGGFGQEDLDEYFGNLGLSVPSVTAKTVSGGSNSPDGPDGADGEVLLDIEVAGSIANGAEIFVYFAPNTDAGFAAAIGAAVSDGMDAISISWGGPENEWSSSSIKNMEKQFSAAKSAGIAVFCASGDQGSKDGTGKNVVDYPAASPNVCGCGGTSLEVNGSGERATEVVWNDNSTSSATGGGVSKVFPGRDVHDVAGCADPDTGYNVIVDGEEAVFGGTSAVAPLSAALYVLLKQDAGKSFDFVSTVAGNATVCFDVTSGNNGAYRAGPGRDEATGFGVVDGTLLQQVLGATTAPPGGGGGTPPPSDTSDQVFAEAAHTWLAAKGL